MRHHSLFRRSALALVLASLASLAFAADTPIYTIQGSGSSSPMVGQAVTTTGVVTKLNSNGFFLQDPAGDGNPATSDGIFVFTTQHTPAVGSLVRVAGTVVEFATGSGSGAVANPVTEISSVSAVTALGSGQPVAPVVINLPLAEGDSFERFEGMLVTINSPLTVQQNFFQARYGQLTLALGRSEVPTNRYRPNSAQALAYANLTARQRILLDDGRTVQNPNPTPYVGSNGVPRAGDTVASVTGVIDYGLATSSSSGLSDYKIHPTVAPAFSVTNPRPAAPEAVGGNVSLAAMNVLNYFTTFTNGTNTAGQTGQGCTEGGGTSASNCRGANNIDEFNRQRKKIVLALAGLNADAVGLMEIQNNGSFAAQNLVDALNTAVGAGTYAVVPDPIGGTGTDAIRVAMIYKPSRLSLVGPSRSDPASVNSRPPMAQTFAAANGEKVTLVVNHLKSKGSCPSGSNPGNTDSGDGQGCWNALRVQQAQQLRTFVAQLQSLSGSNDVLLVGDFNAYAQEDPIYDLTSSGYIDQIGRFYPTLGYSYVFDGASGRLDHAIATGTLSAKVNRAVHWHINADESPTQDYNFEFKAPNTNCGGLCPPDPYNEFVPARSSDHDPILLGLSLVKSIYGGTGRDVLLGTAGDDYLVGGAGADTLTGGTGANLFGYTSLRDAGDLVTDFVPGKDKLDLRVLLASLGFGGGDAVASGWVRFVAVAGGTSVQVDSNGPAGGALFRPLLTLQGVNPGSLVGTRDLIVQ